ncbi:integration host factor subunit alpha [Lactobacillus crispatus]|uniref:DNA-binding protein HU n=1 Tax=Lactobacillus crispatus TaxID=47770 RepID=A0A2M9WNM7_9LACO|nr:HU family DNA-binding protein [Lactobacillus crispatus]MBW0436340.1 HU family DNA-binding protein [Lactobacillus crispatus]MBW0443039.1 HU family DNA-binding protein [Lactobacillus crispatus]MBW0455050.1 HU family DNA-binding protein [Lactobacillus crispatus]MYN53286.1 integration host factor subunit alpha [Lactobacillus crispatus]PJZ17027.1 integration host factor subunit alpha [Lactobacillus crispatus]
METISKKQLVDQIAAKTDATKTDINTILDAYIDVVKSNVAEGNKVQLVGFGAFELRHRAARKGRNPQTGKEIKIAASNVPAFKPGKSFKDEVNK